MITLQTKVIPHSDVIATSLSNQETVLLHMQTQQYYTLNETGTQIWGGLVQAHSLVDIGQTLEARYEITLEQAHQHILELITMLAAEKLVQVVGAV